MQDGWSESTKLRPFADDSLLYRKIENREDATALQEYLINKLQE